MIVGDIQPIVEANLFKSQCLPQIMNAFHGCDDPTFFRRKPAFQHSKKCWTPSINCEFLNATKIRPSNEVSRIVRNLMGHWTIECKALSEQNGLTPKHLF